MEKISLNILKKEIEHSLEKQSISGRYLLDRFCLIDESSRKSPAYVDPTYAPFYYYLGKFLKPTTMMEVGFNLGLLSSSFLLSSKELINFFGFKESIKEDFASNRIGKINLKKVFKGKKTFYNGNMFDSEFDKTLNENKWDLILINEEKDYDKQLQYMESLWKHLGQNGILVVEYVKSHKASKEAFKSFAESKETENVIFGTRYGTGLIAKL
jgi:hypothetical protein